MANVKFDRTLSVEMLEGDPWSDPPEDSTGLVRSVHELRKRPVGTLSAWDLARLIGQDVALPWTLPLGVEILRDTAPKQVETGWYDDELLTAVLNRKSSTWSTFPELAQEMVNVLEILTDLPSYIQRDVVKFRSRLPW
ncbi:contact-dependent growth inhibition system immunity protein [Streptomyces sp. NPDC002055]|uniref:contact-dependent growth inhibition system immunity protein n=1 Tax=Streptomyces sp. NPDC002055 TaxID=3154534 RepID=UPI0033318A3B